jgi:hypothetical protein
MQVGVHQPGHDELIFAVAHRAGFELALEVLALADCDDVRAADGNRSIADNPTLFVHRKDRAAGE